MASFGDNSDMAAAIDDVLNEPSAGDAGDAGEVKLNPQDKGWDAKTPIDYAAYNTTQENDETQEESVELPAWAHNAVRYEWSDEFGDVGPPLPALERQLFSRDTISTAGADLRTLTEFVVVQEGPTRIQHIRKFEDAGLHPVMLQNVNLCKYREPTPIQAYCLPAVLTGNDIIAVAQTGSGKTAAYLIPVISRLMGKAKKLAAPRPNPATYNAQTDAVRAEPLVLIICPTRELAYQIFDDARRLTYRSMLRACCVYGGAPRNDQLADLRKGCDILIGTPGRLKDFIMNDPRWLSLHRLKYTIIDEADEMLNPDWEDELRVMLPGGTFPANEDHQFLLFSATFKKEARQLAKQYLSNDFARIRVGRAGSSHANITQDVVWVEEEMKNKALTDLLMSLTPARTLIFVNAVHKVDVVDDYLYTNEFPVTSIHSQRTQREREDAMRAFRNGKCPIMVASPVTARGLDIPSVMHIINYDLPSTDHGGIDEYVHRIGRTARIGNQGQATSFYNDNNADLAEALVKILLEANQTVPDFLQHLAPEDGKPTFDDDDTDNEGEDGKADNGVATDGDAGDSAAGGWGDGKADKGVATGGDKGDNAAGGWGADANGAKEEEAVGGW